VQLWNLLCKIKTGSDCSAHLNKMWEKGTESSRFSRWLTSAHVRTAVTDACGPGPRRDTLGCHNCGCMCHDCKLRQNGKW